MKTCDECKELEIKRNFLTNGCYCKKFKIYWLVVAHIHIKPLEECKDEKD